MSAPVELEDRVRRSLHRWADSVQPTPGDPHEAMGRTVDPQTHRSRWPLLAVAAAVVLVVVVSVGVVTRAGRDDVDVDPAVTTPPSSAPAPAVHVDLGSLPYLVVGDPGWAVERLTIAPPSVSPEGPRMWLLLAGPEGRSMQVTVSPLGSWGPGSTPKPEESLTVRGQPAFETEEGATRFRVTWDEAGLSWMADGEPFATRDEMVAVLDQLAIVDEGTWQAWLPPEARELLTTRPADGVDYYRGTGAATVATDGPRQPTATVLTPGGTMPRGTVVRVP